MAAQVEGSQATVDATGQQEGDQSAPTGQTGGA